MIEDLQTSGVLAGGSMPGFDVESEEGQKHLLTKLCGEPVVAKRKRTRRGKEELEAAEELRPKTQIDIAKDKRADVLKISTKARELSLTLQSTPYGASLKSDLLKLSTTMERLYVKLGEKIDQKKDSKKAYAAYFAFADEKKQWFEKAQAGHG